MSTLRRPWSDVSETAWANRDYGQTMRVSVRTQPLEGLTRRQADQGRPNGRQDRDFTFINVRLAREHEFDQTSGAAIGGVFNPRIHADDIRGQCLRRHHAGTFQLRKQGFCDVRQPFQRGRS